MQKYLKFVEQTQKINEEFFLNQYEIKLLDIVAKGYIAGKTTTIGDLIYRQSIACSATLHATVKGLIEKELLVTRAHDGDGRTKLVTLTMLGLQRYRLISKAFHRAQTK